MEEERTFCKDLLRYKDPVAQLIRISEWKKSHPEKVKASNQKGNQKVKEETLAHYGKNGKMMCCWEDCDVSDIDMLTVDHINNDGAKLRGRGKGGTGVDMYRKLRMAAWPEGFQTLCWNHQWKKEITRRRGGPYEKISTF